MIRSALIRVPALMACLAAGSIEAQQYKVISFRSQILNDDRRIRVALPRDYAVARQSYPVVYVLDGHVEAFVGMAVAATRYNISGDPRDFAIPPQIVVAVEHKNRGDDLGRNADTFARHLTTELVPLVEKQFRTNGIRILVGHSLGGRFALMASCRMPGFFPTVIAISPGGGDTTTTQCLKSDWAKSNGVLRQVFVSAGERESRADESAKRLKAFLRDSAPPSVRWQVNDGPGLAHTETPYFGIPAGIKFAWDRLTWEMPPASGDSIINASPRSAAIIDAWYAALSARVGVSVSPSAKWLELLSAAQQRAGDVDASERSARRLVHDFPEYIEGYGRLADVLVARGNEGEARKTLAEALRIFDRLEWFDETERQLKRKVIEQGAARVAPFPP